MLVVLPHAYIVLRSFSVPELMKTKGQIVMLTSAAAQLRVPNVSDYCLSKHAINRFAEFITIGELYFDPHLSPVTKCKLVIVFQSIQTSKSSSFTLEPSRPKGTTNLTA